jgi:ferric-dicitrate binding protein FerR (iron transport regulator)
MMDERLAGAIEATRAGDTQLAQLQLTRLLKDDANHAQGWYLLSMLVDSSEKKALFLKKVLAIDPDHAKAQEQLAVMRSAPAATAVPSRDSTLRFGATNGSCRRSRNRQAKLLHPPSQNCPAG